MGSFDDELKAVKNWFASITTNQKLELKDGSLIKQFKALTQETRRHYLMDGEASEKESYDHGLYCLELEDLFLKAEKELKNRLAFWVLCGDLWVQVGTNDKRWAKAFNRYDRRDVHIRQRTDLFQSYRDKDHGKYAQDFLNHRNLKQKIKVYRGFSAREGMRIRKGETKVDDGWFIQEEGAGYSYSLSKTKATHLTQTAFNNEILKKYSGVTDKKRIAEIREAHVGLGFSNMVTGLERRWVGEYTVTKENIIGMVLGRRQEEEIIADKADLIRYTTVTLRDSIGAYLLRDLSNMGIKAGGGDGLLHGNGESKLIKIVNSKVKEFMQDKELIANWITFDNYRNSHNTMLMALDDVLVFDNVTKRVIVK